MSMEMDRRPAQRSFPFFEMRCTSGALAVAVLSAALLGGCDQTLQKTTASSPRDVTQEELSSGLRGQPTAETLVDRAEQDVDYFLQQRRTAGEHQTAGGSPILGASPTEDDLSSDEAMSTIEQAQIIWNEPIRLDAPQELPGAPSLAPDSAAASSSAPTPNLASPDREKLATETNGNDGSVAERALESSDRLIAELSRALYRDAATSDAPLRELMLIAATSIIDADHAPSPTELASLTERDRELLSQMQRFFAELGDQLAGAEDRRQAILGSVTQLAQTLDQRPPLAISSASLCTRVRGFGDYDEFDKASFLAQAQQRLIVYVELDNFTSALNDQQQWVTELAQELVIYSDRDGIPVWSESWQSVVDVTRNKRQDFFTVQLVTLPAALSVGKYYLKVRMRDEATGAMAEKSIAFEMVADPRMAASGR